MERKFTTPGGPPPIPGGGRSPPPGALHIHWCSPQAPQAFPRRNYHSSRVTAEAEIGQRRQRPIPLSLNWLIVWRQCSPRIITAILIITLIITLVAIVS